jgi:hypothetical protein
MQEIFQVAQFIMSVLLLPLMGYIITIERRLMRLETKLEMLCKVNKNAGL